jgi:hypothetical protein
MSGINIAKRYVDVADLVRAHGNSLLEVNKDGSIRTQNLGEKLANLGSRLFGKYEARRVEKDAKAKEAIIQLFNKSGVSASSYAAPSKDRILLDRFFNPVNLTSRKAALKDHKSTTGAVFVEANQEKHQSDLTVGAQKALHEAVATTLERLANTPEFRGDTEQIQILARITRDNGRILDPGNAAQKLNELKRDLQPLGLALGSGLLEEYDISKGLVQWAKKAIPNQFD